MAKNSLKKALSLEIADGQEGPVDFLDDEIYKLISDQNTPEIPLKKTKAIASKYIPSSPGQPWRDFQVQNCARRFLKEVVLPHWRKNHPHKNCSNIRVDEWGRALCKYINPTTIGVDGPWENPTHFLFYAYNTFQTQQKFGIRLSTFMRDYCNINVS
jgi:hypothetical protein